MQPANVPDLTARQLHAVLAVAEYNSFIAAAAFLKTSQPALTRTILRVEDVLGVRLFDRSTRRVAITSAGKEFVAVAERMLKDHNALIQSLGARRANVVLFNLLKHGAAHHPSRNRGNGAAERHGRKDQMSEPIPSRDWQ